MRLMSKVVDVLFLASFLFCCFVGHSYIYMGFKRLEETNGGLETYVIFIDVAVKMQGVIIYRGIAKIYVAETYFAQLLVLDTPITIEAYSRKTVRIRVETKSPECLKQYSGNVMKAVVSVDYYANMLCNGHINQTLYGDIATVLKLLTQHGVIM